MDVAVTASASRHHAIGATGPLLGIWGIGSLLGGIMATRVDTKTHRACHLILLITALAAGHAALILAGANLTLLGGLLLLAGVGIAPATGAIYALAVRAATPGQKTEAFAWLLSANATGSSIGAAIAQDP